MGPRRHNHPDLQLGPQQADYIVGSDYTSEDPFIIQNWQDHEIIFVEQFGYFLLPCAGVYGNQRLDRAMIANLSEGKCGLLPYVAVRVVERRRECIDG